MTGLSQTPANSVAPQSPSADDFQALKAKVIELERQLAELRDTIDPDSINQQFSGAITDSHKELCRVLTWQYVSFCRRLLVIKGRLGIPDSYVSCVVPVDFKCHDLVITVPETSVADFARRPMPFGRMPDPTRRFTRGEFPYLTDEELARLSPRRLEEVSFALPANQEVMVPEESRAVMELALTPDTQDPVVKQEDVDVEVPDTHDPVIKKEETDPEVNSARDPVIKKEEADLKVDSQIEVLSLFGSESRSPTPPTPDRLAAPPIPPATTSALRRSPRHRPWSCASTSLSERIFTTPKPSSALKAAPPSSLAQRTVKHTAHSTTGPYSRPPSPRHSQFATPGFPTLAAQLAPDQPVAGPSRLPPGPLKAPTEPRSMRKA